MLSKPTPVRFSAAADRRLGELADANGMTKAELIRLCVDRFIQEIERTGKIEINQVVHSVEPVPIPKRTKRSA